jgi:KDO2-lipid IV(A) lauroyltransferase
VPRALTAYRAGAAIARALPEPIAVGVATGLGAVASRLVGEKRKQVERNVRRVVPAAHGRRARTLVRRTFESYAHYWVESFRLPGTSPERIAAGLDCTGWEHVDTALDAGKGAILALPHLGGWEWAGFWVTTVKRQPLSVVVEALEPPEMFEWFMAFRRDLGMNVIPLGPAAGGEVVRALKANHIVCLLSDRDIGGGGVEVEFFGERTKLPAGPATLSLRTGAALIPAATYFRGRRHLNVIRPPLDLTRAGRLRDDVATLTQTLAHELEGLIRTAPEQWHLLQPHWPSDRDIVRSAPAGRRSLSPAAWRPRRRRP